MVMSDQVLISPWYLTRDETEMAKMVLSVNTVLSSQVPLYRYCWSEVRLTVNLHRFCPELGALS